MDLSNENMIHIKKEDIEYLQFRKLVEYENVLIHCYTLKDGNYTLECEENYKKICNCLGIKNGKLIRIKNQIHSNMVGIVHSEKEQFDQMDGLVTNKKDLALSLRFADCTPILLFDPTKNVIGNIHSGWKGTTFKIVLEGLNKMIKEFGCDPKDIIACIAPSICKCHFEVDEDVKNIFENTFDYMNMAEKFIIKGEIKEGKQKYYIDTNIINEQMLLDAGIKKENIIQSNICTVCNSNYMHSYRVDKDKAGRNTAIIGLK